MEVLLDPDGVLELHDGARERLDREHALGWGHGQHLPELSQVGSIFSEHVFGRADGCREFGLVIQDGLRFTHTSSHHGARWGEIIRFDARVLGMF